MSVRSCSDPTVGAGLLAMAVGQFAVMLDLRPHREQARSHNDFVLDMNFVFTEDWMWERACLR